MKIWIATYVDNGETCDGKPRLLDICKSKEEAKAAVRNDIERWCDNHAGEDYAVDFDRMRTYFSANGDGCEWNVEEAEFALKRLSSTTDNGRKFLVNKSPDFDIIIT